jgi:hypothetical protein
VLVLLSTSNDKEINPGPHNSSRQYQCGTCDITVDWEDKGIICEICDQWYHAHCQNIHSTSYDELNDSNTSWHCIICKSPNYSTTVHDLHSTSNAQITQGRIQSNSTTSEASSHLNEIGSFSDSSSVRTNINNKHYLRKPVHSSTPIKNNSNTKPPNVPLRIVNINFQSIKQKRHRLENIIDSVNPDIIIGTVIT